MNRKCKKNWANLQTTEKKKKEELNSRKAAKALHISGWPFALTFQGIIIGTEN